MFIERVRSRYDEPHRRYHTWAHIIACFDARDRLTSASLPEVDLALLFHDAVYDPLGIDNEAASAEVLVEEGRRAWLDDRLLQRARVLIAVTKHGSEAVIDSEEACLVVDADLSILGADAATFADYERDVRQEYSFVGDVEYAAGRTAVLQSFLERPAIYTTHAGRRLWEASARENLQRSLAALRAS
jgi:predicted metal-dependent HD superfamily phosphohydrolase